MWEQSHSVFFQQMEETEIEMLWLANMADGIIIHSDILPFAKSAHSFPVSDMTESVEEFVQGQQELFHKTGILQKLHKRWINTLKFAEMSNSQLVTADVLCFFMYEARNLGRPL